MKALITCAATANWNLIYTVEKKSILRLRRLPFLKIFFNIERLEQYRHQVSWQQCRKNTFIRETDRGSW